VAGDGYGMRAPTTLLSLDFSATTLPGSITAMT
jgi:hypothetical protein